MVKCQQIAAKTQVRTWEHPLTSNLWQNKDIIRGNKSYKHWFRKGVKYLNDLIDSNENFITFKHFKRYIISMQAFQNYKV